VRLCAFGRPPEGTIVTLFFNTLTRFQRSAVIFCLVWMLGTTIWLWSLG
jgi:hypothetical protein